MAAGIAQIPWYATLFRAERFAEALAEIAPVPRENLRVLGSGEEEQGPWRIAYTPGHASHHVSYLHTPTASPPTSTASGPRSTSRSSAPGG